MVALFRTLSEASDSGSLQLGALLREIHVRNLAYTHMLEDTLTALFDESSIEAACRTTMGCTVKEIRAVFGALEALNERDWNRRFDILRELSGLATEEMGKAADLGDSYIISPEAKGRGTDLWDEAWSNPGDASTFGITTVSEEAGVEPGIVASVLDVFSTPMTPRSPDEAARDFCEGRSPFRTRPILRAEGGDCVVVHSGLLVGDKRARRAGTQGGATLGVLRQTAGVYLELEALRLIAPLFPGCVTYNSFEYFVPEPRASLPEGTPTDYTKLVEGDGLLIVDDVAVIIEAKAGALAPLSRTGNARRLASDLKKIVTNAASQCARLRERIAEDGGLRLRDDTWLDLSHIREIHAIAVSLDDLSSIATVTSELVRAGLLSGAHLAWTVSVHDLRIITELVERPAEMLLYLRRRTEPDVTSRFHAVDELDFFLEFYSTCSYVEPDPKRVQEEIPQFGEPAVAARRRYKNQRLELLTSRTDQLDAWYFNQLGIRRTPARKPRLNANVHLCELIDRLAESGHSGSLRICTTLLDASGPLQRKFSRHAEELLRLTASDSMPHTLCVAGGTRAENSFVLVWASKGPAESLELSADRLEVYVTAKKHQLKVGFGAGLLFEASNSLSPRAIVYDARKPGRDDTLDKAVDLLGLRPVQRTSARVPKPGRRGRTTFPRQ
jgi:hypothetical protein